MNYKKELKDLETPNLLKPKIYSFDEVRQLLKDQKKELSEKFNFEYRVGMNTDIGVWKREIREKLEDAWNAIKVTQRTNDTYLIGLAERILAKTLKGFGKESMLVILGFIICILFVLAVFLIPMEPPKGY